jgi:hypothetical protein
MSASMTSGALFRRSDEPVDEGHRSKRLAAPTFVAVNEMDSYKSSALGMGTAFVPVFAGVGDAATLREFTGGGATTAFRGFARGVPVAGFRGLRR